MLRVSGEVSVSEDEDEQDNNSYDGSFIDDRINPTAETTQSEGSRNDMMAIYRYFTTSVSSKYTIPLFLSFYCHGIEAIDSFLVGDQLVSSAGLSVNTILYRQHVIAFKYFFTLAPILKLPSYQS